MNTKSIFFGEFIGTFILVFIGCGAVSLAVIYAFLTLYLKSHFVGHLELLLEYIAHQNSQVLISIQRLPLPF